MSDYHENEELLSNEVKEQSRQLKSFKEELEQIDWYNQRIDVSNDEKLKEILIHNRDEEIEHAVMTLEWLRRNMDKWDEMISENLYSDEIHESKKKKKKRDEDLYMIDIYEENPTHYGTTQQELDSQNDSDDLDIDGIFEE